MAWGAPSDPRTFSGYSASLADALRQAGTLRYEFSAKTLRTLDLLRGAVGIRWRGARPGGSVRRAWMWSRRGFELLSQRLDRQIRACGDRGSFLQIGTLVRIEPELGSHFVLTDMSIPQAVRAGHFAVSEIGRRALAQAIDVQAAVLHNARHVFTLTEWARESFLDDFGLSPSRVSPVYAGSNLALPPGLSAGGREREILFVGIDWQRKGGPLLLEAFAIVRRRLPDATLRIVGCKPDVRGADNVFVEGFLDRRKADELDRLARCYLRAACFCLPSLFDPFPNALIEAASAGLPCVAIDNGSRREAVRQGVTGMLAPEPTAAALAEALVSVLEDPARAAAMGRRAQEHAARQFTWQSTVARIGKVIGRTEEVPARCPST